MTRGLGLWILGLAVAVLPIYAQSPDPNLLSPYKADVHIHGSIRVFGGELKGQVQVWEKGFQKFHPDDVFDNTFSQSSEGAISGLYILGADVAPAGDDANVSDLLPFY